MHGYFARYFKGVSSEGAISRLFLCLVKSLVKSNLQEEEMHELLKENKT